MSNQHTPEPWYAQDEGGNWRVMAADENGGYTLADMCCDDQEANARRIVACVNACAGIPTERLDALKVPLMKHLFGADEHAANLVKQRNELLAALTKLSGMKLNMIADGIVDKAITSVKGGAA